MEEEKKAAQQPATVEMEDAHTCTGEAVHGMHTHTDGTTHSHLPDETHTHTHSHAHNHPNQKAVSNRLARAIGHLEAVKTMVDNGEDCAEILIQMAAVRSAITSAGKVLLTDHINHCIVDAVENGDMEKIDELNEAIRRFL